MLYSTLAALPISSRIKVGFLTFIYLFCGKNYSTEAHLLSFHASNHDDAQLLTTSLSRDLWKEKTIS